MLARDVEAGRDLLLKSDARPLLISAFRARQSQGILHRPRLPERSLAQSARTVALYASLVENPSGLGKEAGGPEALEFGPLCGVDDFVCGHGAERGGERRTAMRHHDVIVLHARDGSDG